MADDTITSTGETSKQRFSTVSNEEINRLLKEKDAPNTRRATAGAAKTLKAYLCEKGLSPEFEELEVRDLDKHLAKFYAEVRQENGEHYKRSSLFSLRHGINRHLSSVGKIVDIVHDSGITESNKVFVAMTKELKRMGKGGIDHYPPVEESDLKKMYQYFDTDDNIKLQEKIFVDIVLYFGRRGRENIHELKVSDFGAQRDSEGNMYIYMVKDELTKNHQDDPNSAKGRMYSKPDDVMCPVKTFMKYKRHLNSRCSRLFQRPSKNDSTDAWYDAAPLGHNAIGAMLPSTSEKAGLSKRNTNHSLRATAVHVLDSSGEFAGRHIMTVTGHKSEASLKTYTGFTEPKIKKKMSDVISSSVRSAGVKRKASSTVTSHTEDQQDLFIDADIEPLTRSQENTLMADLDVQFDDEFDDVVKTLDLGQENITPRSEQVVYKPHTWQNMCYNISTQRSLPFPVLNNCTNVTVNFNFNK